MSPSSSYGTWLPYQWSLKLKPTNRLLSELIKLHSSLQNLPDRLLASQGFLLSRHNGLCFVLFLDSIQLSRPGYG